MVKHSHGTRQSILLFHILIISSHLTYCPFYLNNKLVSWVYYWRPWIMSSKSEVEKPIYKQNPVTNVFLLRGNIFEWWTQSWNQAKHIIISYINISSHLTYCPFYLNNKLVSWVYYWRPWIMSSKSEVEKPISKQNLTNVFLLRGNIFEWWNTVMEPVKAYYYFIY